MDEMNGKQLLLAALRGEPTPRPAWVPFVGVHGGHLIGVTADDYLTSADHLVAGLSAAREQYRPDGLPVVFDLQVEAEVLGCDLLWAKDAPPAVVRHPLTTPDAAAVPALDTGAGRFPLIAEAFERLRPIMGDDTALYGLLTGPFTLALHLLGNGIFLAMYDHEDEVAAFVARCAEVAVQMADFYLDHGADVIAVVDPMTSQISPAHFERFVTPAVNQVFDHIRARGGLSSMFVCGDATRVLPQLVATHSDNVSVDENIDLARLRELAEAEGKSFGGNLKLTTVLLLGDTDDAKLDTLRCLDIGGEQGFVLAPGCDLPYATPPANLAAVAELVHDPYQREVARTTVQAKAEASYDHIELPDYAASAAVHIDVITLDSAACAPCQYMVAVAEKAAEAARVPVDVREHKIKDPAGIGMMGRLGVRNIPTICLDGEVCYASIIPDVPALAEAIRERAERKAAAT